MGSILGEGAGKRSEGKDVHRVPTTTPQDLRPSVLLLPSARVGTMGTHIFCTKRCTACHMSDNFWRGDRIIRIRMPSPRSGACGCSECMALSWSSSRW